MAVASRKPAAKPVVQTLLRLPRDLYSRVQAQAELDKRTIRPEIEILLAEAVAAREARK